MSDLHPLLKRQIARHLADVLQNDESLRRFVEAVNEAYRQADIDRTLLERSLDISSQELSEANAELRQSMSTLRASFESQRRVEQSLVDSEERLRQAQKMEAVGMLAGGIAHDFNNLLTAIGGYASLLADEIAPDHAWRRDVDEILKASESAAALTRQLLAFGRRQILSPRILDLNQVVARMESLLGRVIGEDIALVADLAPDLRRVSVDPGQMEQVIMNLAVNARDAMPRGGQLIISTANVDLDESWLRPHASLIPGPFVCLRLIDTGSGIDAGVLPHVFEPFYTTKKRGEGTGLGLATVYGIVKQSGGVITVESRIDQGTTFQVYLPSAMQHAEELREVSTTRPRGGIETILLAEDQAEVRGATRQVLMKSGYTVLTAGSGQEALRVASDYTKQIDLLLTDVVMPGMGGRELATQIRRILPTTRVLYASGYTDDEIMKRGILESDVNFIEKPFTPKRLLLKVRDVLDQPVNAQ